MADIHIEKQHGYDLPVAREKAKAWLDEAKREFGLDVNYNEGSNQDTASIKRSGIDGRASLDADKLTFEAKLAFIAKPLKGMIQQELKKGLDKYFS